MFLNILQINVKNEIASYIDNGVEQQDIDVLTFKNDDLKNINWLNANSFKSYGIIYYILKTENNNKQTSFFCYKNDKETRLSNQLKNYQNSSSSKQKKKTISILLCFYFIQNTPQEHFFWEKELDNIFHTQQKRVGSFKVNLPPPKVSFI